MSTIDGVRFVTLNTFVDVVPVQTASPLKHTQSLPNLGKADVWVNETEVWRTISVKFTVSRGVNNLRETRSILSPVYNARHVANIGSRATTLRVGLYLSTQCRENPRGVFFRIFQDALKIDHAWATKVLADTNIVTIQDFHFLSFLFQHYLPNGFLVHWPSRSLSTEHSCMNNQCAVKNDWIYYELPMVHIDGVSRLKRKPKKFKQFPMSAAALDDTVHFVVSSIPFDMNPLALGSFARCEIDSSPTEDESLVLTMRLHKLTYGLVATVFRVALYLLHFTPESAAFILDRLFKYAFKVDRRWALKLRADADIITGKDMKLLAFLLHEDLPCGFVLNWPSQNWCTHYTSIGSSMLNGCPNHHTFPVVHIDETSRLQEPSIEYTDESVLVGRVHYDCI